MDTVTLKKTLISLEVRETAVVLAASVVLPFLVHLVPPLAAIPLGARVLPMFYAPFIAVILFRPHVAIITGLFSPILNSLLTGHPLPEKVFVLTIELVLFSIISYLIHRKWKNFWGAAPLAYLVTVLSVMSLLGSIEFLIGTIVMSFPGLAILLLINIFLLRSQPK